MVNKPGKFSLTGSWCWRWILILPVSLRIKRWHQRLHVLMPNEVVLKLMSSMFQQGYDATCDDLFISHDWNCDTLRRNAVWLEQCHKAWNFGNVKKVRAANNKRFIVIVNDQSRLHHISANHEKTRQLSEVCNQLFKFQAISIQARKLRWRNLT